MEIKKQGPLEVESDFREWMKKSEIVQSMFDEMDRPSFALGYTLEEKIRRLLKVGFYAGRTFEKKEDETGKWIEKEIQGEMLKEVLSVVAIYGEACLLFRTGKIYILHPDREFKR
jgi:hypothetical protein